MTPEDKAKAYDEALERMKSWARGEHPECFTEAQKTAEFIFPELKESEDEESKKWILEYLYDGLRKSDGQFKGQFKAAIAWLEKQGEQKPNDKVEPKFKVKYAGSEYNVLEVKDSAGITFYGIEDEPNHIDYVKAENCEIISGYAIKENGSPYPTKTAVFSEQNPAWSEEDEKMFKYALDMIEWYSGKNENKSRAVSDWLKSLKDRVQP